jgi:endo-1,4-beta-xylanase
VRLVERLKAAGCQIDGIGMQEHIAMHYPSFEEVEASIEAFGAATGKVMVTELDLDVLPRPDNIFDADINRRAVGNPALDPFRDGLPATVATAQADRYARFFKLYQKHADVIDRVTFWGIDDGRSWHNNWPVRGRTSHSLLFDRQLKPKPAYHAVIEAADAPRP